MSTLTPSYFGPLNEDATFQLPLPGLFADLDAGSASIALPDEFMELPAGTRLGILQQWLRGLAGHKDAALVAMFRDFNRDRPGHTIVRQIEHFREHCSRRGVACPGDLAVLLQRY
ncbi:MAG: hypothetical protein M3Z29_07615 [Pseudomonadota bacterium]|nr:hypothetical protein [Pseudomonadota bacterium]